MDSGNKYLEAGKITNTHSFRGEVKIQSWCDTPEFLTQFRELFLDDRGESSLTIEKIRVSGNSLVASFREIATEEEAIKLKNKIIYIKKSDVTLEEGSYFIQDLIGLQVFDYNDKCVRYGELVDIFSNGAGDVYVIKTDEEDMDAKKREVLIPNVPAFVKKVSLSEGVFIAPIDGMFN